MECEAIRPVIRPFMDDLLDEKEYHGIHAHLESCSRCRAYASSVGTLSYRLYELGQAAPPADAASTILYQFKKDLQRLISASSAQQAAPATFPEPMEASPSSRTSYFWAGVFALCAASLSVTAFFVFHKMSASEKLPPDAVKETVVLSSFSSSADSSHGSSRSEASAVSSGSDPLSEKWPEVHYHVSGSSRAELVELMSKLGAEPVSESDASVVYRLSGSQMQHFSQDVAALTGVVKEYGEAGTAGRAADKAQISIFFE